MTRWVLFILIGLSRRLRAYGVSGDGNPPPFLHIFFLPPLSFLFFPFFNGDVPVHGKAFALLHFRSGKNKQREEEKRQHAKRIALLSRGDAYRWSRTNRLDARTRWATAACGTASIRTRDPWAIRSIVEPAPALRPWPNSLPVTWRSRRSQFVTRTWCSRGRDPEAWATPSPSPESDDTTPDQSPDCTAFPRSLQYPLENREWLRGKAGCGAVRSNLYPWMTNAGIAGSGRRKTSKNRRWIIFVFQWRRIIQKTSVLHNFIQVIAKTPVWNRYRSSLLRILLYTFNHFFTDFFNIYLYMFL